MDNEKVIEKVRKILELSKNNPSEEEAKSAVLQAQRILAKYHIDLKEVEAFESADDITEKFTEVGGHKKWRFVLASIVADNFRCKMFSYNNNVCFYGHATDVDVALETFEYLFKIGHKKVLRERDSVHKVYGTSSGIYDSYCMGFSKGIKDALDAQCTALMIVVPQEVETGFEERSAGFSCRSNTISRRGNLNRMESAKQSGYNDGRTAMAGRYIS
jgi:hypothetical protein